MSSKNIYLLHQIFEHQVNLSPDSLAIKFNGVNYTYQDIEYKANQLAHYLLSKGVKVGDFIGIYFKRSELPIIAMLGILKSGATYIPIDRTFPKGRVKHIIQDTHASIIVTEKDIILEISQKTDVILIDVTNAAIKNMPIDRSYEKQVTISENNLCYIIYTSGTTGKPKGVMAKHLNVVHFVNSFKQVCRLSSNDRLYNGFAYSFDGSVEEIWMAFSSGASLIVASDDTTKLALEAISLIKRENITFFSTVPTFLNMIEEPLDSLRLIILSGEVCPPEIVDKWVSKNLRLLNVYGPTEATVNTTFWEGVKGEDVTIGKPIPNYSIYILDVNRKPVKTGEKGELYIGGKGLAKGYLNLDKQTNEVFIDNAFGKERLYKTGDLVSLNKEENLVFHGRIDSQVKVRGYRIELSEIEIALTSIENISNAVVTVINQNSIQNIVAYVTLKDNKIPLDFEEVLVFLKKQLPIYMIPVYLEVLLEMPRLTSGKINRKQLPEPQNPLIAKNRNIISPTNDIESLLVDVWKDVFDLKEVSIGDDFFIDLGGHSLLSAKATAIIRSKYQLELAIKDIYLYPTIKSLAKQIINRKTEKTVYQKKIEKPNISWVMLILQSISLYLLYGIMALPVGLTMYLYFTKFQELDSFFLQIGIISLMFVLSYPIIIGISILLKWIIIGKIKPGTYELNSFYYYRWWLTDRIQALANPMLLSGSPLMIIYYRLMGAKVGKNCIIDTHLGSAWDLLTIGDFTTVANETQLTGVTIEGGFLKIGSITIGTHCFVGIHSYLGINTVMEDCSKLGDVSSLQENEVILTGISKQGSPAVVSDVITPKGDYYKSSPFLWSVFHAFALVFVLLLVLVTTIPSIYLTYLLAIAVDNIFLRVLLFLCSGPLFVVSFCVLTVLVKKMIFNKVEPGVYKTQSFFYIKKWCLDNLIRLSVVLIKPLYTTIFFPKWVRLMGAKVGKNVEMSTVSQFSPELMTIGDESFFADGSIIGGRKFTSGYIELSKTSIGKRSFVGNSAILPVGTSLGNNCLLGVLSVPPIKEGIVSDNTDWLGSPSFNLPKRQIVEGFSNKVLFKPSLKLFVLRYLIDSLRIMIPSNIQLFALFGLFEMTLWVYSSYGVFLTIILFPLIRCGIAILNSLLVVISKWTLIGRIKANISPLWSTFVWFNEAVNGVYESVMTSELSPFIGTPFYAIFLRLMGCKIGKNVYIGTTLFSEFDLVDIEDNVNLNSGVIIQNHLFEDRIMKSSTLNIKKNCSIGNMSVVLYDSIINQHTIIAPLSLVMKNEIIPKNSKWIGIPCVRV